MSNLNPADVPAAGRQVILEEFTQESPELAPPTSTDRKTDREGLPPGYRMRADAHYVDQLSSRRTDRPADAAPAAAPARDRLESRERRSERLLAQLTEDLATIASAATMLTTDASPLGRRLSADLIKAQTARAAWLVRANAILDGAHRPHVRPRPLGAILDQIRDRFAIECRLSGIALQIHTTDWNTTVLVDEDALVAGISGAIVATIGLIGQVEGAAIKVTAGAGGGELRTIEVTQDDVAIPASVGSRFLDVSWTDRPGGWPAGLGAWTARAVAQQHGGDAVFLSADRRGCTVRLSFSRSN